MGQHPVPLYKQLPEGISIQQTAALLDVSCITVRRWIKSNWIMAYRVGPQLIRIPRSEISRMRKVRAGVKPFGDRPDYPIV